MRVNKFFEQNPGHLKESESESIWESIWEREREKGATYLLVIIGAGAEAEDENVDL